MAHASYASLRGTGNNLIGSLPRSLLVSDRLCRSRTSTRLEAGWGGRAARCRSPERGSQTREDRWIVGANSERSTSRPAPSLRQTPGEQLLALKRPPYFLLLHLAKVLSQLPVAALLGVSDVLLVSLGALQRVV